MKKIFSVLLICLICSIGKTATDSNVTEPNVPADCQNRIAQLKQAVESQQKRIEKLIAAVNELKKENEQLRTLLPKEKAAANIKSTANFDPNNGVVYRGKKRSPQWFNRMYEKFYDVIALENGKYIYVASVPTKSIEGRVLQVLNDKEIIIYKKGKIGYTTLGGTYHPGIPDTFFHIKGYKGSLVDEQEFGSSVIDNGTFEYTDTTGAKRTIQSFIVVAYEPLTQEQFADALNGGLVLVKRDWVGDKIIETPIQ